MKKTIIIVLCIVMLLLAGCKAKEPVDTVTKEQRESVEAECLKMIAAWEVDSQKYQDGDTEAKASANKLAQHYNEYMAKNSYVFGETLPEGIYAAIEPIE